MIITFVNHTFFAGSGPDRVISELSKRLASKHNVLVYACKSDKKIRLATCFYPFNFPLPMPSARFLRELDKSDVINIHFYPFCAYVPFLKSSVVLTFHGWTDIPETSTSSLIWGIRAYTLNLLKFPAKRCRLIISVSRYLSEKIEDVSKTIVIPNGVDLSLYRPGNDLGYALYVGRLVWYKGVHELILAVSTIDIDLHVVGSGPELNKLKKLAMSLGISDKVRFLGIIPEERLIEEYRNCSFLVSASKWEGFGMPFLEANACAKPVIGYNRAAIPERIRHGFNGFLVNDFKELRKYMNLLAEDESLRREMGTNGRRLAERYDWDLIAACYEKAFEHFMR
jgi:glycosyltransferase involved in cell wall biosynthesis